MKSIQHQIRNWNNQLYLDPVPGTEAPLKEWVSELKQKGTSTIVCLNPEEELEFLSPSYYR